MKQTIALFGGSGRTGLEIIAAAGARGVGVRALVRRPGTVPTDPHVTPVIGSLTTDIDVRKTLQGTHAACLVFGPRPPYTDIFCADATHVVLDEMRSLAIPRVLCQTGAMIGDYPRNRTRPFELMVKLYRRRQAEAYRDRVAQEELVRSSELVWTLLKPPRLTDEPPTLELQVGPDVRVGLLSSVSRSNLGQLFIEEMRRPRFERQAVFLRG